MRKAAAALLMCILLFNWFGYRFVADYIQQRSDKQLEARLDVDQYDESQLVEVKVPVHLPYQTTWASFERYDGEMELKGVLYKYVKRKVVNDTLVLLCIPNREKMQLLTAKDDFYKNTNDLSQSNGSKKSDNSKSATFKKLMSEYDANSYLTAIGSPGNQQTFFFVYRVKNLRSYPHLSPEQPPETVAA